MTSYDSPSALDRESQVTLQTSAEDRLASLAEWSARTPSPDLQAVQRMCAQAAECLQACDWKGVANELALHESVAAKWLSAALFEAGREFASASSVFDSFSCGYSSSVEALRLLALSRVLIQGTNAPQAVQPLRRAIRLSDSYRLLVAAGKLLRSLEKAGVVHYARSCRLAMLGNATFDFVLPVLKTVAFAGRINLSTYSGAYNQHMQEALGSTSSLTAFQPEVVVLATDWRSLAFSEVIPDAEAVLAQKLGEQIQMWNALSAQFHCHIIQHSFVVPEVSAYGALSGRLSNARANLIRRLNLLLFEHASKRSGVTILDLDEVASLIGKRKWDDARMWIAAKQYPAAEAIGLLAAHQVAALRGLYGLNAKCLVLDLDNTLWGGVIGEDGLSGIRLGGSPEGEAFVEFQQYIKALRDRGVILAVCSKNNEADARLPFEKHPEMVLKLEDVAVFIANWLPKSENIRTIAQKLNIGIDSLVFVDDSRAECEQVRRALPGAEVLDLPSDPALYIETLHRGLFFEIQTLTTEDVSRAESYRANQDRDMFQQSSATLHEFLSGLRMRVELRPIDEQNLPRISQLINKTNQFNLTTKRMTAEQVRAFAMTPGNYTQFMHLSDRFGDSGITGVLMASPDGDALKIDSWLLSCRVLGRQVEDAMLAASWNYARTHGYRVLIGQYVPTAKNQQVSDLYDRMGFALTGKTKDGTLTYRAELIIDREFPPFLGVADFTGETHNT